MAEYPAGQERLLKQLVSSFRCQICRRCYECEQVRVAARHEHLWVISVRCRLCRNQQVFWFALNERGEETVMRDVSGTEDEYFQAMDPVTSNDVLDMHEFLEGFDGDFEALFG